MKKCLLGCGLVVHNVDEHVGSMHPEKREEFPELLVPILRAEWYSDAFYENLDARDRFIRDHFTDLTF